MALPASSPVLNATVFLGQDRDFGISVRVPYAERPGSPEEYYQGGFRVRRTFDVPYKLRWAFCYGMMGGPSLVQTNFNELFNPWDERVNQANRPQFAVRRNVPVGHRTTGSSDNQFEAPPFPWLFPVAIEKMEGVGPITGVEAFDTPRGKVENALYDLARVTFTYDTPTYTVRTDEDMIEKGYFYLDEEGKPVPDESFCVRYVTRFRQPTAEYLTLPFGGLRWVSDNNFVRGSHGKVVVAQELVYDWHQVPGIPYAIYTHIGCVNDRAFFDGHDEHDRGTLLLTSVDIKPYRWFFGRTVYDITYKVKQFIPVNTYDTFRPFDQNLIDTTPDRDGIPVNEPYGHNHFLRYKPNQSVSETPNGTTRLVKPPKYEMITDNAVRPSADNGRAGKGVYEYRDFRKLFDCQVDEKAQSYIPCQ